MSTPKKATNRTSTIFKTQSQFQRTKPDLREIWFLSIYCTLPQVVSAMLSNRLQTFKAASFLSTKDLKWKTVKISCLGVFINFKISD